MHGFSVTSSISETIGSSISETIKMSLFLLVCSQGIWINLSFLETLLGKELINARSVFRSTHFWFEWHLVLFSWDSSPVNIAEKSVRFEICTIILGTDTSIWISFQKLREQACSFWTEVWFHWNWFFSYITKHLLTISVIVRWSPTEHLIK